MNEPQTHDLSWVKSRSRHLTSLRLVYTMGFVTLSKEIIEKYFLNFKEKFSCAPATNEDCRRHLIGAGVRHMPHVCFAWVCKTDINNKTMVLQPITSCPDE